MLSWGMIIFVFVAVIVTWPFRMVDKLVRLVWKPRGRR